MLSGKKDLQGLPRILTTCHLINDMRFTTTYLTINSISSFLTYRVKHNYKVLRSAKRAGGIYARSSKKTLFKRIVPYFIVIVVSKELLKQFVGVSWVLTLDTHS
jgi:hypothetical protein